MVASRHPRLLQLPVLIASLALALATLGSCAPAPSPTASPVAAAPRGASVDGAAAGTVKIHEGNTESEAPANDPKVCEFHIHFFLGAGTSGTWRIDTQPGGQTKLQGTWSSGSAADVRVPPYPDLHSLPDGQYKLFWSQDGQPGGDKQKVFRVDCWSSGVTPTRSPAPTRAPSPTATTTASQTASAEPTATPEITEEPSAAPTEPPTASVDPEVTPSPSGAPSATPAPSVAPSVPPSPTSRPSASASPSGSVEPESTASASASTPTGPGGSVEGEGTAKPTGAPDTSTAPGPEQPRSTDVTRLLLVLSSLAAAALVVPRPARRR